MTFAVSGVFSYNVAIDS